MLKITITKIQKKTKKRLIKTITYKNFPSLKMIKDYGLASYYKNKQQPTGSGAGLIR
jgi:hypothetical protein